MARAGLTVPRIVTAAADLADEIGFDNVTMSALAKQFGVKDASLYSHVAGMTDLRARVAEAATAEKSELIVSAVVGRAGRDALTAYAHAWRDYALRHPGRYAATQHVVPGATGTPSAFRAVELMHGMLREYRLAEPALTDAVRLLRSTFHGYVDLEASGAFQHSRDPGASWDRIIDTLHRALEHWAAPTPPTDTKEP
ncbi:TetR/AcrR family transcriptional regulator [Nocardia callitridis]|uniref:TetR-like C-terminal domain-containing protein n=1 Tax=Nocardia callitridis TaxID=648753 RepID=A0ABP9K2R6_9NOCA